MQIVYGLKEPFLKILMQVFYHKIIQHTYISKPPIRFVSLTVCQCSQNGSYNCYETNLGSVFPGQTLHIQLSMVYILNNNSC